MPWPTDWAAVFGTRRPLLLEIGFGYGHFLLHLAQQRPDANVIGLEIANCCLATVEAKLERQPIPNVCLVHSTAETALNHLFEPASLAEIHINFPDPWFKSRHDHRRLMQRDTLDAIVSRLLPGGLLYLATDIVEYAEMSHALLIETPSLDNMLEASWTHKPLPGRIITKYEGKARSEGRPCYYFAYRRNHLPSPNVPVIREVEMPHLVFSSPLSLADMLARYTPSASTEGDTHISLMHGYIGDRALLFEVFVKEPTIDQHFAVVVLERERPGEFTLQLSSLGHPRTTPGVHRAVTLLSAWLLGLHPDNHALTQKIASKS